MNLQLKHAYRLPKCESTSRGFSRPHLPKVLLVAAATWLGFATSIAPSVKAANLYWDADGDSSGNVLDGTNLGGSGNWSTTDENWWNLSTDVVWSNTNPSSNSAIFTGSNAVGLPSANGITVESGIVANRLVFERSGYTLSGGVVALTGLNPSLHANLGESVTIHSQISGTGGLIKSGGGSVRLTHSSNHYTGFTTIANGSLIINSEAALGGTGVISILTSKSAFLNMALTGFTGASLVLDGTSSGFMFSRDLDFVGRPQTGESTSSILSLGNNILSGIIATNNFSAAISTESDTRKFRIQSVNGNLTLSGTLNTGDLSSRANSVLGGANAAGVSHFNFTGELIGTGVLEKIGAGTLFLNPSNTARFIGTVRISASTSGQESSVRVTQNTSGGTSVFGVNSNNEASAAIELNGGILEFRSESNLDFNSLTSGKNIYLRSNSTIFSGPGAGGDEINGITSLGSLYVVSNTSITFVSRNGYGVALDNWTDDSSANQNVISNGMGGALLIRGDVWSNSLGTIGRTLTFQGAGNINIEGNIVPSGIANDLIKSDVGTLTLNGTATNLPGAIYINNGELMIRDFRSLNNNTATIHLGSGSNTVGLILGTEQSASAAGLITNKVINLSGTTGTIHLYANQNEPNPVILNANFTVTGAGAKTLFLAGRNASDNVINGIIANQSSTNTTSITKGGAGTWVLGGKNTFTGNITIIQGSLKLRANASSSTIVANTVDINFDVSNQNAGGTLEFVGQDGANNTEIMDSLNLSHGANTIKLTPGVSGNASISFSNSNGLGTLADGATLNIVGSTDTSTVKLTGQTGLNSSPRMFFDGSNFAFAGTGGIMRAAVYGTDADFADLTNTALIPSQSNSIYGSFSTNTVVIDTLKIDGDHTLTIQSGQTLTIRTGAANTDGAILQTGGSGKITGGIGITTGGTGSLTIYVNQASDILTLESPLTAATSGGITKSGAGTLVLSANNQQTGPTTINEGIVRLVGSGRLSANSVVTIIRPGAILDLNGINTGSTIGQFIHSGIVTNSSATAATLQVGNSNGTGESYGIVQDGIGLLNVTKVGTGGHLWLGLSTYRGITTIGSTGQVTVDYLADIGQPSGIGRGDASTDATNAASLVFTGSSSGLVYRGDRYDGELHIGATSASTNRLFTLSSTATGVRITSSVGFNNAIVWTHSAAIVNLTAAHATLTFTGDSTGDNTFNPRLVDSSISGINLSLTKSGAGQWNLGNSNNSYSGPTTISQGILGLNHLAALPANSPLVLGSTTNPGVIQASGIFTRNLSTTAIAGIGTITWGGTTGGGGFAAHSTSLIVTLNNGAELTWGTGGFVGTGGSQPLIFGSSSALADVTFTNPIFLGASTRTITVNANPHTGSDSATMSGVLSSDAGSGLLKNGPGILRLTGANTYTGVISIEAGTLTVTSLGSSTGLAASSVGAGAVTMDDSNAIVLGNSTTTGGILQYVGAGEITDRKIRIRGTTATNQIHADGSGPLILTNVAHDTSETGNKVLALRGSNTSGNRITSVLANNGGGVLHVTIDGNATWILTGENTYSGNTTAGGGLLGIGSTTALGTGTLIINNGNIFAFGADRTITNNLILNDNSTHGWLGDYSLLFTGMNQLAAVANSIVTVNSLAAGKTLTFQGLTANLLTKNQNWVIDGTGETVMNRSFTTSTLHGVTVVKTGDGILVLGTNGMLSNWNKSGSSLDIDRGSLKFSINNALPITSASYGGLVISPEIATGDIAEIDLNGTTQTINALTAKSDGVAAINNRSASSAEFRFGANHSIVDFGSGTGSYSILNTGSGALDIVKLGNTTATFKRGITLAHKGATASEGGGVFQITSAVSATTSLRALEASTLALAGGITNPNLVNSVQVSGGSTLTLLDNVGTRLTHLNTLSLGNTGTGTVTLNINVGDQITAGDNLSTDLFSLIAGGTLALGNSITFNMTDTGLNPGQTYTLLSAPAGGLNTLGSANFIQGSTPGGFTSITWNVTDTLVQFTTGTLITGSLYWRGQAGGGMNQTWNASLANWSLDKANTIPATSIPGSGTSVKFAINSASGTIVTTLEQNFRIHSLTFEAGTSTPTSITIAPGTAATNRLDIAPQSATEGITLSVGAPPNVTISAPLHASANQTWLVADAAATLTLSGGLSGQGDVTKTGLGNLMVTASDGNTWNGDLIIHSGTVWFAPLVGADFAHQDITFTGLGKVQLDGVGGQSVVRTGALTYVAGTIAEVIADNTHTSPSQSFILNQTGSVTLGTSGMGASMRLNLADTFSEIDISGPIQLGGNSSISVGGNINTFARISGVISDAGNHYGLAIHDDAGGWAMANTTLQLTGLNTFTGSITVSSGTLEFNSVSSLGSGPSALGNPSDALSGAIRLGTAAESATLNYIGTGHSTNRILVLQGSTGGATINANGTGPLELTSGARAEMTGAKTLTLGGTSVSSITNIIASIQEMGSVLSLNKTGSNTWRLSTPNNYTGTTVITEGILAVTYLDDANSSLGNSLLTNPSNLLISNGATLRYSGTSATSASRSFTIDGLATIESAAGAGPLVINTGATFTFTPTDTTRQLNLTAHNVAENRFEAMLSTADVDAGRAISSLIKDGIGSWIISENPTGSRFQSNSRISVNLGTLGFEAGVLGSSTTSIISIADGARLQWVGSNNNDVSARISVPANAAAHLDIGANNVAFMSVPDVATGGKIVKEGIGTLTFSETVHADSVDVDVVEGRFIVLGAIGVVSVQMNAGFVSTGSVDAVTVHSGGRFASGNSIGSLTANSLTLMGGSIFEWEVRDAIGEAGTGYDSVNLTGSLNLSGANSSNKITIKLITLTSAGIAGNAHNFNSTTPYTFTLGRLGQGTVLNLNSGLNITDVFAFDTSDFRYTDGSTTNSALWSIGYNVLDGMITLTAVPEPSTYAFAISALALAAASIRRTRKNKAALAVRQV